MNSPFHRDQFPNSLMPDSPRPRTPMDRLIWTWSQTTRIHPQAPGRIHIQEKFPMNFPERIKVRGPLPSIPDSSSLLDHFGIQARKFGLLALAKYGVDRTEAKFVSAFHTYCCKGHLVIPWPRERRKRIRRKAPKKWK